MISEVVVALTVSSWAAEPCNPYRVCGRHATVDAMKLSRRRLSFLAATAAALPTAAGIAWAQAYPSRPVRWLVGYAPGGGNDIVARLMGQWFSERLGQPFVIENRPGAATNMAAEAVVHAAPDGYTLLLVGQPNAINATLYDALSFNFIRDIAPVAGIMTVPNVMVIHPSFPAKTVPEFIAYAKANPGKINMASAGNGSAAHLAGELFSLMTGISMVHVPYRGQAPAIADLLAGQVLFATSPASIEYVRSGARRGAARQAVRGRIRAGLRGERMVRHRRAAEDARRDHRAAEQGGQCRSRRCQVEGPAGRPRRHPDSGLACRLR
jgi:tripartite-type tricarboxylate transporter receptor subunit TctC